MATITTTQELQDTITDLLTPVDMPDGKIGNKLSTYDTNLFFQSLEEILNALYVKCRQLEDLHNFATLYIQKEFDKCQEALDSAIDRINNKSDVYANITEKITTCDFNSSSLQTDRDGTPIVSATIYKNKILPHNLTIKKANLADYTAYRSDFPYRLQENPLDSYKSFYILESINSDGVTEKLNILFDKIIPINFFDISIFGCTNSVKIIRDDNILIETNEITNDVINAKGIEITLKSVNAEPINLSVSSNADSYTYVTDNYKNELKDNVFNTYLTRKGGNINVRQSTD